MLPDMSTHCLKDTVPGTKISLERDEGSKRTQERLGIKSCSSLERKRREGQNPLKAEPSARHPSQDIVPAA